jgi:DNA-binding NarL/FixJ family response regulator
MHTSQTHMVEVSSTHQGQPALGRPRASELGPSRTLTSAELRVAELVCAGHSRSAVAKTLFVSVNTVGTHLCSIYSKLQVNSRMQLLLLLQSGDLAASNLDRF